MTALTSPERDELVRSYVPLAHRLSRRYHCPGDSRADLEQVASLGLVLAAQRFDPARGNSFASFAVPTILGELRRHVRDHGWALRVPRGLQEDVLSVSSARDDLSGSIGRAPTLRELADYIGSTVEAVLEAIEAGSAFVAESLDRPRGDDEDSPGFPFGADEPGYELVEYGVSIHRAWTELSDQERAVVYLRFVQDLMQSEIAARIGVSQMQVSRLLRRALRRLRHAAGEELASAA